MIELEIDGVSYKQVFMMGLNIQPKAILGVRFFNELNFVIILAEERFKTRRNIYNV